MKEKIYTIPVLDGFKEKGPCPFCSTLERLELNTLEFTLSPAYMEDDVRKETNELGFCRDHLFKLYAMQNRLGLSLILHTRLKKIAADLNKADVGKTAARKDALKAVCSRLRDLRESCYVCSRVERTFARYVDTFFYMWKCESEFAELVASCGGFCLEHYATLLEAAAEKLSQKDLQTFADILARLQEKSLEKLDEDLNWFILKFDYRYADEPWKDSKDALARAMAKISSVPYPAGTK